MNSLLVNEIFWTVQGEGRNTGLPSVFIRLQGCDVGCPWCDTGHSLKADPRHALPDNDLAVFDKTGDAPAWTRADVTWIVDGIMRHSNPVRHAVITGGEPFLQNADCLIRPLMDIGYSVQVETSGTRPLRCPDEAWITLSPKRRKPPLSEAWQRASEIKVPIQNMDDILFWTPLLDKCPRDKIALQPVSLDRQATSLCIKVCMERAWRLSLQTHKLVAIR